MLALLPDTKVRKVSSGDIVTAGPRVYLVQMTETKIYLISLDGVTTHGHMMNKLDYKNPGKDIEKFLGIDLVRGYNWFSQEEYVLAIKKRR